MRCRMAREGERRRGCTCEDESVCALSSRPLLRDCSASLFSSTPTTTVPFVAPRQSAYNGPPGRRVGFWDVRRVLCLALARRVHGANLARPRPCCVRWRQSRRFLTACGSSLVLGKNKKASSPLCVLCRDRGSGEGRIATHWHAVDSRAPLPTPTTQDIKGAPARSAKASAPSQPP